MPLDNIAPLAIKIAVVEPILVDLPAVAELTSMSQRTVGALARDGGIPSVMVGHRRLFVLATIREWALGGCQGAAEKEGAE